MGGQDKGLVAWKGAPLIERLYQVARPLTDDLIISCNRNQDRYADFADRLVVDSEPEFPGPLAGIRAGLSVARHPLMLVLPCDAPLVDQSLITDMRRLQLELPELPLMVRQGSQWQPLFCLIPKAWQARLELAWADGERSARRVLLELGAVALDIGSKDPRTANFNTPDLLAE